MVSAVASTCEILAELDGSSLSGADIAAVNLALYNYFHNIGLA